MDDLARLAEKCHERGISLCMDFVMNHTSDEHEWARRARAGEGEYMSRYFFTGDQALIDQYTRDVPQVFPTTAPGHFTYLPELGQSVMTQFYPYQWDLNYKNPRVFNEMMYNFLYLANQGMDVIRIDAVPYIWKQLGHQLPQPPAGPHDRAHDAHDLRGGVPGRRPSRRGRHGAGGGRALLWAPSRSPSATCSTTSRRWPPPGTASPAATTRLLRRQLEAVCGLPRVYTFLNYLRCHDDIAGAWTTPRLSDWGMEEVPHKRYLNAYLPGAHRRAASSRGELYQRRPRDR